MRNNKNPLVTIGVASYNNARFIKETLDSIAFQSYKEFELIINDDCSSDNSVQVIRDWMEMFPMLKITLIENNTNYGLCKSLNQIIENSKGEYISIIASDDKYLKDFILNRVNYLKSTEIDIGLCYSPTYLIDSNSKRLGVEEREKWLDGDFFVDLCRLENSFCKPLTTMIKREVYEKVGVYDEALIYEDLDFFFRVSRYYKVSFFESIDSEYRVLGNSLGHIVGNTPEGLESTSLILKKNWGKSKLTDLYLAKRLRKIALKKRKLNVSNWKDDFLIYLKYYPNLRDYLYFVYLSIF